MARQTKALAARRRRPSGDDSMLIRSAESLGRMIGSLQRQLDSASKKLGVLPGNDLDGKMTGAQTVKTNDLARARASAPASKPVAKGSGKPRATPATPATAARASKRPSKSAPVKNTTAGRARRKTAKTARRSRT